MKYQETDKEIIALGIDLNIKTSSACQVFRSCSKNSFFRQMDSTQNMMGFLNFLGTSGVYQGNPDDATDESTHIATFYKLVDDESKTPLEVPVVNCETDYDPETTKDEYGYPVMPEMKCGCSSCQKSCVPIDWTTIVKTKGIFHGFQTKSLYLAAFLIVMVIFSRLWSWYRKKRKAEKRESLDSYDRIKTIIEKHDEPKN